MNCELISLIILVIGLIGMGVLIFRKIPVLIEITEFAGKPSEKNFWQMLMGKIKNFPGLRFLSPEIFLQKLLSRIRILTLKTDNKTSGWLQKLREKSQKKKLEKDDNYWQKLKKSTKKR